MRLIWGFDMRVEGVIRGAPRSTNIDGRDGHLYALLSQAAEEDDLVFLFVTDPQLLSQIHADGPMAFQVVPRQYHHLDLYEVLAIIPTAGRPYTWHLMGVLEPRRCPAVTVNMPCRMGGRVYHNPKTILLKVSNPNHRLFGQHLLRPGDWLDVWGHHTFESGCLWMRVHEIRIKTAVAHRQVNYQVDWSIHE